MVNPQSVNACAYVTNSPLRYTDPTGRSIYIPDWNPPPLAPLSMEGMMRNSYLQQFEQYEADYDGRQQQGGASPSGRG